ncbi:As/Sb Reductase [Trypanosoma rangeli]|uniref:As/Sb Reductase n=1 Tax=Trypanosoma rangeli TaxID=5698 RepID=A0A3R7KPC6_TRYRA|nr:As/Sb Reductase [Trypanosoma rangeli]RNF10950.1 As/Sb Reductase [Trypanosoma rangeli]|eukprot:RNF10950.1 As/Sb Reductase [Trypanosoma rangeli]
MPANYTYMDPSELVALLDDGERCASVAVIDCRDDDRAEGFIVGSVHFPSSSQLERRIHELAASLEEEGRTVIVFHCSFSQVRGPRAANRFAAALREKAICTLSVYVLRGGWNYFYAVYGVSRPELIVQ